MENKQPKVSDSETIQCGRLKNYQLYSELVIIDAKSGETLLESQIGEFFYYFQSPTRELRCRARGLLFNETEFVLVEFNSGELNHYVRGKLTALGSLELVQSFLRPFSYNLLLSVQTACELYGMDPVPHSSVNAGSATLGVGNFGIVLHVLQKRHADIETAAQKQQEKEIGEKQQLSVSDMISTEEEEEREEREDEVETMFAKDNVLPEELKRDAEAPAIEHEKGIKEGTSGKSVIQRDRSDIRNYFDTSSAPLSTSSSEAAMNLPAAVLKVIYKSSKYFDYDFVNGLALKRAMKCENYVISPVFNSFHYHEERTVVLNNDLIVKFPAFSSYLMHDSGQSFSPEKPPKRAIQERMLIALGYIHSEDNTVDVPSVAVSKAFTVNIA